MASFMGLSPEVRCIIYRNLFRQPDGQLLALSREPEHDYSSGPPSDWVADSRQAGLVYDVDADRVEPTNSRFLRTCRKISSEATPIFYGANKISLYAEDNNDIFYWLLDIGEHNRRAIRHLEISWAYGVSIASGRGNIHHIMEIINDMDDAAEEEIQKRRRQLIRIVQRLEQKTLKGYDFETVEHHRPRKQSPIIRTLNLLITNQDLISLGVYLPGIDGGDIWDIPNENIYFAEEIFSNSTTNVHACIPKALTKMVGIQTLTIGYTKDIALAETIAREAGAKGLVIRTCPEGHTLNLSKEDRAMWIEKGWRLEGQVACKTLIAETAEEEEKRVQPTARMQREESFEGNSEGGRLKADMEVDI